jgi:hypothetical protein
MREIDWYIKMIAGTIAMGKRLLWYSETKEEKSQVYNMQSALEEIKTYLQAIASDPDKEVLRKVAKLDNSNQGLVVLVGQIANQATKIERLERELVRAFERNEYYLMKIKEEGFSVSVENKQINNPKKGKENGKKSKNRKQANS